MSEAQIHTLALGLFNEWLSENWINRLAMVRRAYRMEPGPERLAALKFLKLVEQAREQGVA